MKITGQLDIEDHVKARRVHLRMGFVNRLFVYLCPLLVILNSLWIMMRSGGYERNKLYVIAAVVILVIYPFQWQIESRLFRWKLMKRRQADDPLQIEISEDGMTRETPEGKQTLSWLRFVKYKLGKDEVLLYRSGMDYQILPFRWFTPEQRAEFEGYLRKEIGEPVG